MTTQKDFRLNKINRRRLATLERRRNYLVTHTQNLYDKQESSALNWAIRVLQKLLLEPKDD